MFFPEEPQRHEDTKKTPRIFREWALGHLTLSIFVSRRGTSDKVRNTLRVFVPLWLSRADRRWIR
jgi:hypothetical protein